MYYPRPDLMYVRAQILVVDFATCVAQRVTTGERLRFFTRPSQSNSSAHSTVINASVLSNAAQHGDNKEQSDPNLPMLSS